MNWNWWTLPVDQKYMNINNNSQWASDGFAATDESRDSDLCDTKYNFEVCDNCPAEMYPRCTQLDCAEAVENRARNHLSGTCADKGETAVAAILGIIAAIVACCCSVGIVSYWYQNRSDQNQQQTRSCPGPQTMSSSGPAPYQVSTQYVNQQINPYPGQQYPATQVNPYGNPSHQPGQQPGSVVVGLPSSEMVGRPPPFAPAPSQQPGGYPPTYTATVHVI